VLLLIINVLLVVNAWTIHTGPSVRRTPLSLLLPPLTALLLTTGLIPVIGGAVSLTVIAATPVLSAGLTSFAHCQHHVFSIMYSEML